MQREKIEAWAAYRGFTVVGWYTDLDRPAKERDVRPEFERMMAAAAAGRFEAVAVYRLTRFARSVSQAAARYSELRRHNVALVSVTEDIDTTTASGSFMQNILFSLAEFESQRIGEEWRNVHANRRRRGIAHVNNGIYGYRVEGAEIVALEPAEAPSVGEIYRLRLQGRGLGTIRLHLREHGFRPKRGGAFFSKSSIADILANPTYAGLLRMPDGELVDGRHEAIVTRDQWEAAQAIRPKAATYARHRVALLSGLLVCHSCGYRLVWENPRGYRCRAKYLSRECAQPVFVSPAANDHVEQAFLRRFDPKRMPHGGRLRHTRQQQEWRRKAVRLRSRVDELTAAIDTLADRRFLKGSLAQADYDRQFNRYATERARAAAEADELEQTARTIAPLERDVLALWPTLGVEEKQRAMRILIERVVVKPLGDAKPGDMAKRLQIRWLR